MHPSLFWIKFYCGKSLFLFSFMGENELPYDLKERIIHWVFNKRQYELKIDDIGQVGYFPDKKQILFICNNTPQRLLSYNMSGELIFNVCVPTYFAMLYFSRIGDKLLVICDGDSEETDRFGRFRYNFVVDWQNGHLTKDTYAY